MAERTSKSASSSNFAPDRFILRSVQPKIVKFYFVVRVNSLGHQLAILLGHQPAIIPRFGDDSLPLRLIIPNLKSKYGL